MYKLGIEVVPNAVGAVIKLKSVTRMGFARLAEDGIRSWRGKKTGQPLTALDKIVASALGTRFPFPLCCSVPYVQQVVL
jgi:hypothetical protein